MRMPTDRLEAEPLNEVLEARANRVSRKSDGLLSRSASALDRLHPDGDKGNAIQLHAGTGSLTPDIEPSLKMRRKHVIIVNSDPEFLEAARVVLQDGRYNVTTTNLVPLTYQMVEALGASVMVIGLMIEQPQIWSLVEQLRQGEKTRMLPIVFISTDPQLLENAERLPWRSEGRYVFVKPFSTGDLVDVIRSLIGSA